MKIPFKYFGIISLLFTASSHAALISVNASADMTSGLPLSTSLLPIGTTVSSDIQFDIGAGTYRTSNFTNVSGTFTWLDNTLCTQTFNADNARITTTHSEGWFNINFTGLGPTIDGITADNFSIVFDVGTNPFVSPSNTTELYDLVLNSTVSRMRVGARQDYSTHYGDLESNVSGTISAVPIPGALILFMSGLLGLFASRSSRINKL